MTELLKGKYLWSICFLYFVLIFAYSYFSESIPVSDGLGWDGVFYGELATDFFTKLNSGEITNQKIRRILPSFIIYVSLFLSDRDHNIQNVIIFFKIFNAISLSIALFYWINICKALNFCKYKILISTTLAFINFMFIKFVSYYPVLTDYFSYALTIAGIYYWLRGDIVKIILITIMACFTWPALFYQMLILLCFPYTKTLKSNDITSMKFSISVKYFLIFFVLCSSVLTTLFAHNNGIMEIDKLTIGFANSAFLIGSGVFTISCIISTQRNKLHFLPPLKTFVFSLLTFLILLYIPALFKTVPDNISPFFVIKLFILRSFEYPLINLLPHAIILSPFVIYILTQPNKLSFSVSKFGSAGVFIFLFGLLFIFNSESRHMIHFYPFLVLFFIDHVKANQQSLIIILLIQIIASSFYILINTHTGINSDLFFVYISPFISESSFYYYLLPFGLFLYSFFLFLRKYFILPLSSFQK